MPILLNDLTQNTNLQNVYAPTFFSDRMTGRGKSTGLLSANNNPLMTSPDETTLTSHTECGKRTYRSGQTTVHSIPVNPVHATLWQYMRDYDVPDKDRQKWIEIGKAKSGTGNDTLYMQMKLNAISIEEITDPNGKGIGIASTTKKIHANYQIFFCHETDPKSNKYERVTLITPHRASGQNPNVYTTHFSSNPLADLQGDLYRMLDSHFDLNAKTILDYIADYSIYEAAVDQSEAWQTDIHEILKQLFQNIVTYQTDSKKTVYVEPNVRLLYQLKYIMNYNIPLDLYKDIYQSVRNLFVKTDADRYCKENLNLLLSATMDSLEKGKSQIPTFTPMDETKKPLPASVQKLSPQQKNACMATEPLVIVQSGAGTGKSSTIKARIDYMCASGVKPNDIMVLSFTNAAADHIKELNPNLHSMTIASMIHELYSANFTNHKLSSLDTIINSIDIYYANSSVTPGTDPIHKKFKNMLYKLLKNEPNAYTETNTFIEDHYDEVIEILDTIQQTSLELEIIICYQKIDVFTEPDTITSKYLIMDEVQDNSVFEFVYVLKYVDKHKEPLYLVGDCSQTLYEFRSANPKAMNILEGSGTFKEYQLTVNFRSNQEILNFANILLSNIEANQYANIQLQANSLAAVTEQSFLDRVNFNYLRLPKVTDFKDALPSTFATEIKPYIDRCIARDEQVAFLAYTKNEIGQVHDILKHMYPGKKVVSLVPTRTYNSTIFSSYIRRYWHELKFAPSGSMIQIIESEIMSKLPYLTYNSAKAQKSVIDMLAAWKRENVNTITSWQAQVNANQITQDVFMDLLKENMLTYEINTNAIKQALISNHNREQKDAANAKSADFLLSTIHSAKGLEFDNVVVLHKNKNQMDEENKRMYYVAFTRAMHTEYVLSYDTVASPQIEADYYSILQTLHAKAPALNSPLNAQAKPKKNKIKI